MEELIKPSLLKKYLKTTLNWLIFSILLGFSFIYNPNLIINPTVLKWATVFLNNKKFSLQWQDLNIHIKSKSLLQKQINLSSKNLCFKGEIINGCIEDFKIVANFKIDQPFFLQTIEVLKIQSEKISISEISKNELTSKNQTRRKIFRTDWSDFDHREIDILIKKLNYISSKKNFKGSVKIVGNKNYQGELVLDTPELLQKAKLTFNLNNFTIHKLETWKGNFNLNIQDSNKQIVGTISSHFENYKENFNLKFNIFPDLKIKKVHVSGPIFGVLDKNSLKLDLQSDISGLEFLPQISLSNCFINISKTNDISYLTNCRIVSDIVLPLPKKFPDIGLPKFSGLDLSANFKQTTFLDPINGVLKLKLDDIQTPLFTGQASSQTFITGDLKNFPKNFNFNTEVDFGLTMEDFKTLIHRLRKTNWSIPAPLNQLSGPISFGFKGKSDINQGFFPFFFNTRLNSKFQKVNIDGHGELILNLSKFLKKENHDIKHMFKLNLDLSEIILAMPRMKLEAPPALFPDSRIAKFLPQKEIKEDINDDLNYNITVKTNSNPVKIISNLISTPVPITLEANFSSHEPFKGNIALGNFPVEIFKRKANVDFLKLEFQPYKHPMISGQVQVKYVDYDIGINLLGTTEKPLVKIDSDPVLTQEEALAVLLYGRTLQELDSEQQESVGNTRSALADQSLGLASLYLLASTPIESLGYNEATQEVSAKVKIGDGTSLNLGSSAGGSRVGIRRRISKNLTITTDYRREDFTDTESGVKSSSSAVETLIEWSLRY